MNVLHLTLSFHPGGRRRAIQILARHLVPHNIHNNLACLQELGCASDELKQDFATVEVIGRRSAIDIGAVRWLAAFCAQHRIDIIHAHDAASQYFAALLRLLRPRYKLLMTFHRTLDFESATLRDRMRNAFANGRSAAVVTCSQERRQCFLRDNYIRSEKVLHIPLGIGTERFYPDPTMRGSIRDELGLSRDTFLIGAIGHFGPEKGIDVAIRAFQALCTQPLPNPVALVILGTGTDARRAELQTLAASVSTPGIHFVGFQADTPRWLQAFDLFVHAPRLEAFGLAVVEAMASELAVVATSVGGIPEIVRPGRSGVLVAPDQPAELAAAMRRLMDDSPMRQAMGAAGLRVARAEYDARLYAERYHQLYRALIDGRPIQGLGLSRSPSSDASQETPLPAGGTERTACLAASSPSIRTGSFAR